MEFGNIIISIVSAIVGGGLASYFTYKLGNRKQDVAEFKEIVTIYKELSLRNETKVKELQSKVNKVLKTEGYLRNEIQMLRNKIVIFESSHADIPLPMWLKDHEGRMLFVNDEFEKEYLKPRGFSSIDYIGKDDFAVWPDKIAKQYRANDRQVMRSKKSLKTIEEISDQDGLIYYAEVLKYPRKYNGEIIGISGIVLRTSTNKIDLSNQ